MLHPAGARARAAAMAMPRRRVWPCDEHDGGRRRWPKARVVRARAFVRDGAGGGDGIDQELGLQRLGWEVG